MFYCLNCNKIHYFATEEDYIFLTGFHFVENRKLPAGLCRQKYASHVPKDALTFRR
ncbi:DUF3973 domain-containing protein [Paenibacillus cremeus]|uniref:DUF3973 domain-containing protein n=1 Tax=Paenibacillus cremeus TaxID=2163881 RepID=UPI001649441C